MSQVFFGNFDFEYLLARGNHFSLPASIKRINAELAICWMLVAQEGDSLVLPQAVDKEFWDRMQLTGFPSVNPILLEKSLPSKSLHFTPWGWSKEMVQFAERNHLQFNAPPLEAVQQANSRKFSALLEEEFQVALPEARMVTSFEEFSKAVQQLPTENPRWVVKNEFSNSARERIIGQGTNITEAEQNWMTKRWKKNNTLFFEPWVNAIEEAGIHFTIPMKEETEEKIIFDGVTPLFTDASGRYCGSRVVPHNNKTFIPTWQTAIDVGFKVATRLQAIGYFGPIGIDAMHFRQLDGSVGLRPLQEINARWTMGRLALGLRKLLQPEEVASWLHLSSNENQSQQSEWNNVRVIPTSTTHVSNKPVQHQTLLCIANNVDSLKICEQQLLICQKSIW